MFPFNSVSHRVPRSPTHDSSPTITALLVSISIGSFQFGTAIGTAGNNDPGCPFGEDALVVFHPLFELIAEFVYCIGKPNRVVMEKDLVYEQ